MSFVRSSISAMVASTALLFSTAALAHPKLIAASPAPNATVGSTTKIELHFNEALVGQFSSVDLAMTEMPGMKMNSPMKMGGITTAVGPDGRTLVVSLKKPLSRGTYRLDWHAVSADTHRVDGNYSFTVK